MEPVLNPGVYVFAVLPLAIETIPAGAIATFREAEGLTVVLPEADARRAGLEVRFRAAWITLNVPSDLAAIGLTAAFARALAAAEISCNVIAAACHDHIFVPVERAEAAIACLQTLQTAAREPRSPESP